MQKNYGRGNLGHARQKGEAMTGEMNDLQHWQRHFFDEAKRIFKLFEEQGEEWDPCEVARDIQALYDTMPHQLREIVDDTFDHEPNPGELLVKMAHVHLCAEKVLGRRASGANGLQQ
jgi:hypothetical protein